ncbi:MAG: DUF2163 domain-containing protein, partial [Parcubacteria group bacterium]|nr:DUF2163 domain-containing protein [Parcubacteria group bacterium]
MPRNIDALIVTESQLTKNNPIFLLEIYLDGVTLRYTDNNEDVVFPTAGNTYTALGFSFSPVRNSITNEIDRVNFELDNVDLVFSGYVVNYVFQNKIITLKKVFGDKLSSADYATIVFSGEMRNPSLNEETLQIEGVSPIAKFQEEIPRRVYQGLCPWTFDGEECRGSLVIGNDSDMKTVGNWLQVGTTTLTGGYNSGDSGHSETLRIQFDAIN